MMPCIAMMNPAKVGIAGGGPDGDAATGGPRYATHATTSAINPKALIAVVIRCVRSLHCTPRQRIAVRIAAIANATGIGCPASGGTSAPTDSANTNPTAAMVPHVDAQSLHPTMKLM